MSNDQPKTDESAVPFSEKVTADTLSERTSIPSFDTRWTEWEPETGLRLEAILRNSGFDKIPAEGQKVIVILGPANTTEQEDILSGRPIAVYNQATGQKYDTGSPDLRFVVTTATGHGDKGLIKEGEHAFVEPVEMVAEELATSLEITAIKSGPLT